MALQPLPPVPNTPLVDDPTRDSIWKRYLEQLFNRVIPLGTGTVTSINVSSLASGLTFTGGPVSTAGTIVMGGTLNVSSGGTGVNTLTGYVIGNGTSPFTATTAIHVSSVTGVLPIANGGTATSTALTSSAVMVSNGTAIVQGPLGTSTTVLHGNTSLPFYSAVALASDVSGILAITNGGTGVSTGILASVSSMGYQSSSAVAITGGTINATAVGPSTASTGSFTILNATTVTSGAHTVSTGNLVVTAGEIVITTSSPAAILRTNTADASDNNSLALSGGGAVSATRGGVLQLFGNEHGSFPGNVLLQAGGTGIVAITGAIGGSATVEQLLSNSVSGNYNLELRSTTTSSPFGLQIVYSAAAPNGTSNDFIACEDNTPASRFVARSNGGLANYQANDVNLCDERVKSEIAEPPDFTEMVKKLTYKRFRYFDADDLLEDVIAQDLEKIAPELVGAFDAKRELKGVYTYRLQQRINSVIPLLIKRIEELERKLSG